MQGYEKEKLDEVHAPIGIAIQSDTPAEIAISIVAELIQKRAQLRPQSTTESVWQKVEKDCILATIYIIMVLLQEKWEARC